MQMRVTKPRSFINEFGREITLQGQVGGCTGMGNPDAHLMVHYRMVGPKSETVQSMTAKEAEMLRDLLIEMVGAP